VDPTFLQRCNLAQEERKQRLAKCRRGPLAADWLHADGSWWSLFMASFAEWHHWKAIGTRGHSQDRAGRFPLLIP